MSVSHRTARPVLRLLCAASVATLAATAYAAAPADPAPEAGAPADSAEILVTATRRAERNVDVPVSVSTLSGEKLDVINSSGQDIRFLSGRVPSLNIESSFGRTFPRFYIRGLGNTDFSADAAQPVSIVLDNVALESPFLKAFPIFDSADVEVLKGPQGTLFGRNTPAGVVKITSKRPTDTVDGFINGSWGTYNTVNSTAAIGGPLTDKLRIRLSGQVQRRDDWVHNDDTATAYEHKLEGYRDIAGRFQVEYEDGPFDALLNAHGRTLRGSARVFRASSIEPGTDHFVPGFDPSHVYQDGHNPQRLDTWGLNSQLSYKFEGLGTLFSVTGYEKAKLFSRGDIDGGGIYDFGGVPSTTIGTARFPVETGGYERPEEFTEEVRFASEKFGHVSFQAGAYYFNGNLDDGGKGSGSWDTTGALIQGSTAHLDNQTYAVFGSAEYTPIDQLILRGGLRWSHDRKNSILWNSLPEISTAMVDTKASGSKVSWDGSATYKITPDMSFYARVASGYLGTSIKSDTTAGATSVAKPQTTTSYEAGFKGQTPGNGLTYSIDGYYSNTKNIQLTAIGGSSNVTRLLNARKAIGYGVEAEFTARPLPNLELTAGGSYNFTKIKDNTLFVAIPTYPVTMLNPVSTVGGAQVAYVNGNPLPQAPKWIGNFTVSYSVPLTESTELFAFTDWAYRSKVNFFLYEAVEFTGRASFEGGLRAGYRDKGRGFEIAGFVRNITNQIRAESAIDFDDLTSMINEPRIAGVEFNIHFK